MPQSLLDRPGADEYAPYYAAYIRLVPPGDLLVHFERQRALMEHRFRALTPDRAGYRYAPDKWSVRDVLCHLTDTERVFSHRAITFARGDRASLPSFEQVEWAAHAEADARAIGELLDEWHAQRMATIAMVRGLSDTALLRRGTASGVEFSVRALLHIPLGHVHYHLDHLASAYGVHGS